MRDSRRRRESGIVGDTACPEITPPTASHSNPTCSSWLNARRFSTLGTNPPSRSQWAMVARCTPRREAKTPCDKPSAMRADLMRPDTAAGYCGRIHAVAEAGAVHAAVLGGDVSRILRLWSSLSILSARGERAGHAIGPRPREACCVRDRKALIKDQRPRCTTIAIRSELRFWLRACVGKASRQVIYPPQFACMQQALCSGSITRS